LWIFGFVKPFLDNVVQLYYDSLCCVDYKNGVKNNTYIIEENANKCSKSIG